MNRDIQIVVKDRVARAVGQPVIVCGNGCYTVTFSFDDEWSEAGAKTARFKYLTDEGMKHIDKEFTGNVVQVPVLSNIREVEVGVYSADLATSTGAPIRCEPSIRCNSGDGEQDIVQTTIEATQEACRAELEGSLETVTGESHDGKTWEELNDTVATLSTITEEQTQALGYWDLIKAYFADYTGGWHDLFRNAPTDTSGTKIFYTLPYIYTPRMAWVSGQCYVSSELLEFGVDVSSAVNLGGSISKNTFQPLPKLQKLILTGNENSPTLNRFMLNNSGLVYLKMNTPSEAVLQATQSYYNAAFNGCNKLETIDCELDFTGQTDTKGMFTGCYQLKDLKIKPFTLSTSLDLGACWNLRKTESGGSSFRNIITVLNAITNDIEVARNMTITFSEMLIDFTTSSGANTGYFNPWSCMVYWDPNTLMYTLEEPPYIEGGELSVHTSLYGAFIDKGVTIEWK